MNLAIVAVAPVTRASSDMKDESWRCFMMGYVVAQPVIYGAWGSLNRRRGLRPTLDAFMACTAVFMLFSFRWEVVSGLILSTTLFLCFWLMPGGRNLELSASPRSLHSSRNSSPALRRVSTFDLLYFITWLCLFFGVVGSVVQAHPWLLISREVDITAPVGMSALFAIFLSPVLGLGLTILNPNSESQRLSTKVALVVVIVVLLGLLALLIGLLAIAYLGACLSVGSAAYLLRLAGYRLVDQKSHTA